MSDPSRGSPSFRAYRRTLMHVEAAHVANAEDVDRLEVETRGQVHHRSVERHKGCVVNTREGSYEMAYPFWVALDVDGFCYPIAEDVFARTYEATPVG